MKKLIILLAAAMFLNTGCKKFLNETPSEGGLEGFREVGQFDALLNDLQKTRNRYEWRTAIYGSDDCFFHPDWRTASSSYQIQEALNVWNENELKGLSGSSTGFYKGFSEIYTFNYITEKIDDPSIEGSSVLKKQLKGEAMFFRALIHFNLSVEHCMHPGLDNGNNPGLGYRNTTSTNPSTFNDRKTVKFTMDGVLEDLTNAEQLLEESGKGAFDINQPWRVTKVAVEALRARIELYLGNYAKAFEYAKKAYTAYNFLYDMNDASKFNMLNRQNSTTTCNGVTATVTSQSPAIFTQASNTTDPNSLWNYKESYFRYVCQISAVNKLPPSQELYDLYNVADLRKVKYYDNNMNAVNSPFPHCRKDELISKSYMGQAIQSTRAGYRLGVSVPEIMLIMAECRARGAGDGENANVILKTLRQNRFPTGTVDNIGSTLQEVQNERRRELAFVMRWYDLKRYNALDNANITVTKLSRSDVYDVNSTVSTYKLEPKAKAYALPIPASEISLLEGWAQNEYGGVTKQ